MLQHTFENYINKINEFNLHPKKIKDYYDKLPNDINKVPHLILFGKEGIGKYSQALKIISKYTNYKNLKYEKKLIINFNKEDYIFSISDIHFEVDMSLLGCNSKVLFNEIISKIIEVVEIRKNRTAFVLCKNFQNIHHELLEVFYTYLSSKIISNVQLKFIILTNCLSFIPNNIINCSVIIPYDIPSKSSLQKLNKKSNYNNDNINIKSYVYDNQQLLFEKKICNTLIDRLLNKNIDYSEIRENIYEILTCNLNVHNCLFEINKEIFKHISNDKISKIINNSFIFFKHYNNNYRPIYHLENYFYYLLGVIHEYE